MIWSLDYIKLKLVFVDPRRIQILIRNSFLQWTEQVVSLNKRAYEQREEYSAVAIISYIVY